MSTFIDLPLSGCLVERDDDRTRLYPLHQKGESIQCGDTGMDGQNRSLAILQEEYLEIDGDGEVTAFAVKFDRRFGGTTYFFATDAEDVTVLLYRSLHRGSGRL